MKQHAEITYNQLEKNENYDKIINRVIDECFTHENLDKLNLYISITLTIPDVIHELNKKYRNVDRATDVLSFPMFEKSEIEEMLKENGTGLEQEEEVKSAENVESSKEEINATNVDKIEDNINEKNVESDFEDSDVLGDLVISIPKVYEQAEEYGHSFERELSYMCVHGFYHLMGYDHIEDEDKIEMRKKEDEILNKLGITRD